MPRTIRVLMYCTDDALASVYRFVIESKTRDRKSCPILVYAVNSEAEAELLILRRGEKFINRVLIFHSHRFDEARNIQAASERRGYPSVFVDAVFSPKPRPEEWLMRLRTCRKKTGPKPVSKTGLPHEAPQVPFLSHSA